MTYINGVKGGLVANVVMYESPQFTTDDLLKIVASKDIGAGEELLVDYGSEYALGDLTMTALLNAAFAVDAAGADGASGGERSEHVTADTAAAEGTSVDGPSAQDSAAPDHGLAGTSGGGASAHGLVSTVSQFVNLVEGRFPVC